MKETRPNQFKVSDRVQLHPGLDLWMRGTRYGTVTRAYLGGRCIVMIDATGKKVSLHDSRLTAA